MHFTVRLLEHTEYRNNLTKHLNVVRTYNRLILIVFRLQAHHLALGIDALDGGRFLRRARP